MRIVGREIDARRLENENTGNYEIKAGKEKRGRGVKMRVKVGRI